MRVVLGVEGRVRSRCCMRLGGMKGKLEKGGLSVTFA